MGICFANSPEFVAAAKGGSRVFGTNPLAIGIPQANSPYPFTVRVSSLLLDILSKQRYSTFEGSCYWSQLTYCML